MRQAKEHEYIGQVDFDLVKRLHNAHNHVKSVRDTNALYIQGVEALMYHPMKDDLFVFARFNDETQRCKSLSVYNYGDNISDWSIHEPEGNSRSKLQLQISYVKDVQKKRPRNIKRSCNPKVIKQMVSEIHASPIDETISHLIANTNSLIDAIPEVHKHLGGVNTFFRELYYANSQKQIQTLKSILGGGDGGDWPKPNEGFSGSALDAARFFLDKHLQAQAIKENYRKHVVGVFSSPMGKYKVVRHIVTGNQIDVVVNIYPSKEALPVDIVGNLSVLDIAQSGLEHPELDREDVRVPGVGSVDGMLKNQFFLVGENFVDPRVESQGQSSQTS